MDSNRQEQAPPPSHGYRSYAEIIKQRLIYGRFYAGWSMRQGGYNFRVMYPPDDGRSREWQRQPLGYEMTERHRAQSNVDNWVIRVYLDGTALFRPYKLNMMRYPTVRTITNMMDYFFYKEAEVPVSGQSSYEKMHVLRRKPINPQHITPQATGFGDFLEGKYNRTGGRR